MEVMKSRIGILVYSLPLLLWPWQAGQGRPVARFVGLVTVVLVVALLARGGARVAAIGKTGLLYVALVAWAGLSIVWSANAFQSVVTLSSLILLGGVIYAVRAMSIDDEVRGKILRVYLMTAGAVAIWGMGMYILDPYERLTGLFYQANVCAAFLLPAVLLGFQRALRSRSVWWSILAVVIGSAFVLTDSRGGSLMLLLAASILAIVYRRKLRRHGRRLAVLAAGVGLMVLLMTSLHGLITTSQGGSPGGRFAELAEGKSTSGSDRWYFLRSAYQIWQLHPVEGSGLGTYGTLHPQYQERVISASTHAHNLYAEVLADLGIVGFGLLGAIVASVLYLCINNIRKRTTIVLSVSVAITLIYFGLDIAPYYPVVLAGLGILLGLLYSHHEEETGSAIRQLGTYLAHPAVILIALIGVAVPVYLQTTALSNHTEASYLSEDSDVQGAANLELAVIKGAFYDPDYLTQAGIYMYSLAGAVPEDKQRQYLAMAVDLAERAQRRDSHDSQHWQLVGRVQLARREYATAESSFRQALKLDPYNHPEYAFYLGGALIEQGKTAEAQRVYEGMLAQYSDEVIANRSPLPTIRSHVASLYAASAKLDIAADQTEQARAKVRKGLQLNPDNLQCRALARQLGI